MSDVSARGPSLHEASPSDDVAVRAVFAEQRALLDLVRGRRLWGWLGGMPSGFGHPKAALYGLYHELSPAPSLPVPAELALGLDGCRITTVQLPAEPLRSGDLLLTLSLPSESDAHAVAVLPDSVLD